LAVGPQKKTGLPSCRVIGRDSIAMNVTDHAAPEQSRA
jgi:hypothetical protein